MKDAVSEVYKSNFHVRFDNAYYSVDRDRFKFCVNYKS